MMTRVKLLLGAIAVAAMVPSGAAPHVGTTERDGAKYYVSPGSVGGVCSDAFSLVQAQRAATPWCTVDRAASQAPANAVVYVRGGSYERFTVKGECRSGWVTIKPYPNERVVLDGAGGGADDFTGAWEVVNSCYLRIEGFELTDRFFLDLNNSNIDLASNWVHSKHTAPDANSGSRDLTVSGVATRCSRGGCTSGHSNITIRDNHFEDIAYNCLGSGSDPNACDTNDNSPVGYGYCIQINPATPNLIIAGNHLDGCWEDGIQGGSSGMLIEDNRFTDIGAGATSHSDGIQMFQPTPLDGVTIRRNV